MVRYRSWVVVIGIVGLCALTVPARSCSREVAYVHAR